MTSVNPPPPIPAAGSPFQPPAAPVPASSVPVPASSVPAPKWSGIAAWAGVGALAAVLLTVIGLWIRDRTDSSAAPTATTQPAAAAPAADGTFMIGSCFQEVPRAGTSPDLIEKACDDPAVTHTIVGESAIDSCAAVVGATSRVSKTSAEGTGFWCAAKLP